MTERSGLVPDSRAVRRRRDRAAAGGGAGFLAERSAEGLFERLAPINIAPDRVLDLGSGSGWLSRRLAKRWKRSRISSVDWSTGMLRAAAGTRSRFARIREVAANPAALPFRTGTFDVVVANLSLPLFDDQPVGIAEAGRVLRAGGLFLVASLGPDTLAEVRDAWREVDELPHVVPFADMHEVGDAMVRAGLRDPVLDVERLTVTYGNLRALYRDLRAAGAGNVTAGRRRGLTGKSRFSRFETALQRRVSGGELGITIELVFGHAWGGSVRASPGEFRIDPAAIGRRPKAL